MRLYGLCKTGILGAIAGRGGHQSGRYRSLRPRRGNCACYPLFAQVPCYSFSEAGQLQGRAMPGY